MVKLSLVLYNDTTPVKRGQHCTMYYTHLYGEIRKLIILLYMVFDEMTLPSRHRIRKSITIIGQRVTTRSLGIFGFVFFIRED